MEYLKSLSAILSNLSRRYKQVLLFLFDILFLELSLYISFVLRLDTLLPFNSINNDWWIFILIPIATIPFFILTGLYHAVLKHIGSRTILAIIKSTRDCLSPGQSGPRGLCGFTLLQCQSR